MSKFASTIRIDTLLNSQFEFLPKINEQTIINICKNDYSKRNLFVIALVSFYRKSAKKSKPGFTLLSNNTNILSIITKWLQVRNSCINI